MELWLRDGRIFDTTKLKLEKGAANSCHENAARLWVANEQVKIVTGFALHDQDEMWRRHSWVWNPTTGELTETTARARKYFGVVLSELQAHGFALENVKEFNDPSQYPPRIRKGFDKLVELLDKVGEAKLEEMLKSNEEF